MENSNQYQEQYQSQYQYQNQYQNQYQRPNPNNLNWLPPEYKPLSPWAYLGYNILFVIPIIGLVFLIIFAFSDKNINRRNYARSYFCAFLIGILLSVVVIVPLTIFIFNSSTSTISQANYASFAQQFGEFSDIIQIETATLRAEYGKQGITRTKAQVYYEIANNKAPSTYLDVPYGEKFNYDFLEDDEECYEIVDYTMLSDYYDDFNFYGNENDGETHYITSEGNVFTLPGYREEQKDGTIKYYVNSRGDYYIGY